jgi:hypothetical protein
MLRLAAVVALTIPLGGCVPRPFPYEHLVLAGEMSPTKYGGPGGMHYIGVDDYPTRYELRRPEYTLHAAIAPTANTPNMVFYVVGRSDDAFTVTGSNIRCGGAFMRIPRNDPIRAELPLAEEQFRWMPEPSAACADVDPPQVIRLTITSSSGARHTEAIPFIVVRNGIHWELDAL